MSDLVLQPESTKQFGGQRQKSRRPVQTNRPPDSIAQHSVVTERQDLLATTLQADDTRESEQTGGSRDDGEGAGNGSTAGEGDVAAVRAAECLAPVDDADFIFLQGSMCIRDGRGAVDAGVIHTGMLSAALEDTLRLAAARGLPMICANPDFQVTLPSGKVGYMPGVIASAYEALGGSVSYFGKPHAPAYAEALRLLGPEVPR